MTFEQIIENVAPDLEKVEIEFKAEMMKLRTGRLSPALIEDIQAECFGSVLPIKQLGNITSVSQREIQIQLWDKTYVEGVVKSIEQEELGLSMRIDDNNIFLTSPPLTQESRDNLIHVLNKKKEETFQGIRHLRDKAWKKIQEGEKAGEIREDDKFKGKDKLDESIRKKREGIEEMVENKEKEIKG